ncbi:hypothetical protein [Hungatella hathewayi]|uniref:hypothetical protein n=1 Tax=Hungatella hathewayi TaxID=154046 RepID=UPI00356626A2
MARSLVMRQSVILAITPFMQVDNGAVITYVTIILKQISKVGTPFLIDGFGDKGPMPKQWLLHSISPFLIAPVQDRVILGILYYTGLEVILYQQPRHAAEPVPDEPPH